MRNLSIILTASFVLIASGLMTSGAQAAARYCLQSREWGYPGNCQFSTYRQCMAAASGTSATCGINPQYAYPRHRSYRHY